MNKNNPPRWLGLVFLGIASLMPLGWSLLYCVVILPMFPHGQVEFAVEQSAILSTAVVFGTGLVLALRVD